MAWAQIPMVSLRDVEFAAYVFHDYYGPFAIGQAKRAARRSVQGSPPSIL